VERTREPSFNSGLDGACHVHAAGGVEHVDRLGEHIADEGLRHRRKRDPADDAAGLQVVDGSGAFGRAFRRHILPAGIHGDIQDVFAALQPIRDLVAEGQVSAQVFGQRVAVHGRRRSHHNAIELQEHAAVLKLAGQGKALAVSPDIRPHGGIPILPGQPGDAMRQGDFGEGGSLSGEQPFGSERNGERGRLGRAGS
jgi:hypothetical protein